MWSGVRNLRANVTDLNLELASRIALLLAVILMQLHFHPHVHIITEAELLSAYKRPRRDSYVPVWALGFLVVVLPFLVLSFPLYMMSANVDSTQAILAWTLALSINAMLTEVLKLATSRPRPDFFYRCFPDGVITEDFECTGNVWDVIEGRKSFPSGHSSYSFCSMGFLSLWLCGRLRVLNRRGQRLQVLICMLPIVLATMVAISRYWDNHHHLEDVIAGSLLGLMTSYLCYCRYYNPLNSELSGYPFLMSQTEIFNLTNDLNYIAPNETPMSDQ